MTTGYARWLHRRRFAIAIGSLAITLLAGWLGSRLTVEADLSYLLPPSTASVQELRAIERRARVLGTVMVAVQSADPARRGAAARALRSRLAALPPAMVSEVTFDEHIARQLAWEHRWLYASLADLTAARDALRTELRDAHLRANPLYVDLDDAPPSPAQTLELRAKLREAERTRDDPGELVSKDGRTQLLVVRTANAAGDIDRDRVLLAAVAEEIAAVRASFPGVEIGVAGDIALTVAEHDAVRGGMVLATLATVGLVVVGLLVYYRTLAGVLALSWALLVGALSTFAFARLTVGHLNLATAFLSSIVIGNGINFGIMLLARFMEARRTGAEPVAAIGQAIAGTVAGTLAAAMIASVAYGSLTLTSFRGFRDFGIIAGVGILACWLAAYTVLPAVLLLVARWIPRRGEPTLGRVLRHLAPRRPRARAVVLCGLLALAGAQTWQYLAGDPFESNFRNLRSHSPAIDEEARWMAEIDRAFGQGISGGFVIAVARREQTAPLVAKLRAIDAQRPEGAKLFARLSSLDDLLPADQPAKLALLAELRDMLSDEALAELSEEDRAEALALRPPAGLVALRDEDVPEALAWPFIEADGSRGKLVLAMAGWSYENWDARDIVRFADDLRGLDLGPDVLLGGDWFVFADMLRLLTRDGPLTTLASLFGAVLLVLVVVGRGRHGIATVVCGVAGTLLMLALASWLSLRVNFLDFVALPITIGIGIDYAVNLAARDRHEPGLDAGALLAHAGSAVLVCSFTTIVGYGSLLLSRNQAIQSFGTAAILGEATCLVAALVFAPALLQVLQRRSARARGRPQRSRAFDRHDVYRGIDPGCLDSREGIPRGRARTSEQRDRL